MTKEFIKSFPVAELIPYDNNPRNNDEAVDDVAESMEQCGDLDPIEVDENNVILSGHTRLKAMLQRGQKTADVIRYTGLTEEQKKKYRLLANKTSEKSAWDFEKLEEELKDLDFNGFDFGFDEETKGEIERTTVETPPETYEVVVECTDEFDMQEKYDELTARGYQCRILTL